MKTLIATIMLMLLSTAAHAACPSIDDAIAKYKKGRAPLSDVTDAIACEAPTCDVWIAALTNNVEFAVLRLEVGDSDARGIVEAAKALAAAKEKCRK